MSPELSTEGTFANTNCRDVIFVIVAMTEEEASMLATGDILNRSSVRQDDKDAFYKFHKVLIDEHNFVDFNKIFGRKRDDWKPDRESDQSIEELITTICGEISGNASECNGVKINPCFLSSQFFEKENDTIRRDTWNKIKDQGGIMIIDTLSLHHPDVAHLFFQSGAGFNDRIAILVHSPVNLMKRNINKIMNEFFASETSQYRFIYDRFNINCDRLCEIDVGDLCSLRRWLFSALLAFVPNEGMSPENHEIMPKHVGPKYGMNTKAFSGANR